MGAYADASSKAVKMLALGAATTAAAVAIESVRMASSFQTLTERIHTQADASQAQVDRIRQGILQLAGSVAETPNALADAAYHVESVGLRGAKALDVLKTAAEGAKIGGADLTDVTNGLDAAVVSGIKGVQNYQQAMGALNATVGAGDMSMQNLADALGTGVLAVIKGYGVNLRQAGAALAVFGDNNIRGAKAGTDLRMSVQSLTDPLSTAGDALAAIGLKGKDAFTHFATDLQHGGLQQALTDLHDRLVATGNSGKKAGELLTEMFGKRAGTGIAVLTEQYSRFEQKMKDVKDGAGGFASSWAGYTKTFSFALDSLQASVEALLIKIGDALLPTVTKFTTWLGTKAIPALSEFGSWLERSRSWVLPLVEALGIAVGSLVAFKTALLGLRIAAGVFSLMTSPMGLALAGITALAFGLIELYKHSETFRTIVTAAMHGVEDVFNGLVTVGTAMWRGIDAAWRAFADGPLAYVKARISDFSAFWDSHSQQIKEIASVAWKAISTVVRVEWDALMAVVKPGLDVLQGIFKAAWDSVKIVVKTAWDVIGTAVAAGEHIILDAIGIIIDLLTGKWGKAWAEAKNLVSTYINAIKSIIMDLAHGAINMLYSAGKDIIQGLINGIKAEMSSAIDVVKSVGSGIIGAAKSALKIFSPSREFYDIGTQTIAGLTNGIHDHGGQAVNAAKSVASDVVKATQQVAAAVAKSVTPTQTTPAGLSASYLGTFGSAQEAQAVSDAAAKQLATITHLYDQEEGAAQAHYNRAVSAYNAFENKLSGAADSKRTAEDRKELASLEAAKEAAEKNLTAVKSASTSAISAAKTAATTAAQQATTATQAAETAAKNLLSNISGSVSSLLTQIKGFQSTVSQGLTGDDSLNTLWQGLSGTDADGNPLTPTISGLQGSLNQTLSTAKTFAGQLKQIAAEGGSQSFITQILGMGPTQGSQVASQLLSGGSTVIKQMSATLDQINALTTVQSQQLSQTFYGQGAKALQSYVMGLESKFPTLRKALAPLAGELSTVFGQSAPAAVTAGKTKTTPHEAKMEAAAKKQIEQSDALAKEVLNSKLSSDKHLLSVVTTLEKVINRLDSHGTVNHDDLKELQSVTAGLGRDIAQSTVRQVRKGK